MAHCRLSAVICFCFCFCSATVSASQSSVSNFLPQKWVGYSTVRPLQPVLDTVASPYAQPALPCCGCSALADRRTYFRERSLHLSWRVGVGVGVDPRRLCDPHRRRRWRCCVAHRHGPGFFWGVVFFFFFFFFLASRRFWRCGCGLGLIIVGGDRVQGVS